MSKADEPAFPQWIEIVSDTTTRVSGGITKRELFAAMAMQGLLANEKDGPIVKQSVIFADALIAELEKQK